MKIQWSAKFRSKKQPPAKIALGCEMILQPHSSLCENFRSCETTSWHTSAISQLSTLISQLRNGCEILKALKTPFLQPKPHFAGCFAAAKHPFGTRVPFRSTLPSFRSCEMGCEMVCENAPWLRKWILAAKSPLACEMGCENGIWLRNGLRNCPLAAKSPLACENAPWLRKSLAYEMDYEIAPWLREWLLAAKSPLGCEMVYENAHWLRKWPLAAKSPPGFEIDL